MSIGPIWLKAGEVVAKDPCDDTKLRTPPLTVREPGPRHQQTDTTRSRKSTHQYTGRRILAPTRAPSALHPGATTHLFRQRSVMLKYADRHSVCGTRRDYLSSTSRARPPCVWAPRRPPTCRTPRARRDCTGHTDQSPRYASLPRFANLKGAARVAGASRRLAMESQRGTRDAWALAPWLGGEHGGGADGADVLHGLASVRAQDVELRVHQQAVQCRSCRGAGGDGVPARGAVFRQRGDGRDERVRREARAPAEHAEGNWARRCELDGCI